LVQTAEGALSETTNILQRVRELAVQAANGTQSTNNRLALDTEVDQLLAQIDDIAFDTEFNGVAVLSSGTTLTLQTGAFRGQDLSILVGAATQAQIGVSAVNLSTAGGAISALSTVDAALRSVNSLRSNLGAFQNRLEFT